MLTDVAAPDCIPIGELRAALDSLLGRRDDGTAKVRNVRRRRSAYSSSHEIDNLDVRLADGRSLRLVVKNLSPASLLPTARRVRPEFLYDAGREIRTYTRVLAGRGLGTPHCYGAFASSEPERRWLFLERVEGVPLWQAGAVESWEGAARWLGGMHAAFGLGPGFRDDSGMSHLPRHDARFFATWAIRAAEFVRLRFGTGSPRTRRRFERIVADYDAVVRRLVRMPVTLVHGEFYPSNILLRPDGSICPVDWELAAIGPSLLDVAALVSGEWTAAQRARMANAYRRALESAGRTPGPVDAMSADIDCCRLHLAMQWLGWAADWNPPGGHARDWLREALRLAERLGIG